MAEQTIPWWRKALNFALGGIRSGFGLFSRSAKPEPAAEATIAENAQESLEVETPLTKPSPQPEIVAAEPVIQPERVAEPVAPAEAAVAPVVVADLPIHPDDPISAVPEPEESMEAAEPIAEVETVVEAVPEPVAEAETEAEIAPAPEQPLAKVEDAESFPSGAEAPPSLSAFYGTAEAVPFQNPTLATALEATLASEPEAEVATEREALAEQESEVENKPVEESGEAEVDAELEVAEPQETESESEAVIEAALATDEAEPNEETEIVDEIELPEEAEAELPAPALLEPVPEAEKEAVLVAACEPAVVEVAEPEIVNESATEPTEDDEATIEIEDEAVSEPVAEEEAEVETVPALEQPEEIVENTENHPSRAEAHPSQSIIYGTAEAVPFQNPTFTTDSEAAVASEPEPSSLTIAEPEVALVAVPQAAEGEFAEREAIAEQEIEVEIEPVSEPEEEAQTEEEIEPEIAESVETEVEPESVSESTPEMIEVVEPVAEAEAVDEAVAEIVEETEAVRELAPETIAADGPVVEIELDDEAVPEPVEEEEAEVETAPTFEQPVAEDETAENLPSGAEACPSQSIIYGAAEAVPFQNATFATVPEAAVDTEPELEAPTIAEPEVALVTEPEAASEGEFAAHAVPAEGEAPAERAAPALVLTPEPTAEEAASEKADEKAAAKLAARQKKLDEGSEQSPFSVLVGQVYDGPLDLLLDLIRKQDIDIYDIPIAKITAQFLAYVNQLKSSDVDVAGEFIYTASLLIHIKSRMLLPRAASDGEDAAEDPRRELVERLLEHERFKNAAQMLQQKQMLEAATWSNPGVREFKDDAAAEPEIAADTVDLVRIFRDILERARKRPAFNVEEDSVTVGQMIQFLGRRLTMEDKPVALRKLLSQTNSERALIAMFLALLELVRLQAILLRQDRAFSEIFVKKHTGFETVMSEGLMNTHDDWR